VDILAAPVYLRRKIARKEEESFYCSRVGVKGVVVAMFGVVDSILIFFCVLEVALANVVITSPPHARSPEVWCSCILDDICA